jgi:hypothetical protein
MIQFFTFRRASNEELEHVVDIYHWCKATFAEEYVDWQVTFGDTDDEAVFAIYNEAGATMFKLRWK